jgi:hypothetical protein
MPERVLQIGDRVRIINSGREYTGYEDFYRRYKTSSTYQWDSGENYESGSEGTIVNIAQHTTTPRYGDLAIVNLDCLKSVIISVSGLELIEEGVTMPTRYEWHSTEADSMVGIRVKCSMCEITHIFNGFSGTTENYIQDIPDVTHTAHGGNVVTRGIDPDGWLVIHTVSKTTSRRGTVLRHFYSAFCPEHAAQMLQERQRVASANEERERLRREAEERRQREEEQRRIEREARLGDLAKFGIWKHHIEGKV